MAIQPELQIDGEPLTANDDWLDANIRHQIGLMRVAGRIRNDAWQILDATEQQLRQLIVEVLSRPLTRSQASRSRVDRLVRDLVEIRAGAWQEVGGLWRQEMIAVVLAEPQFMRGILETVLPVEVDVSMPSARDLRQIVTQTRFEGRTLAEEWRVAKQSDIRRIEQQVRLGVARREAGPAVARRVVGRKSLKGRDGTTQITRRQVATVSRDLVNHGANQSRSRWNEANPDFIIQEVFVAILDGQTTPECRSYDGDLFAIEEGPIPPLHRGCRSERIAALNGQVLGERTAIPVTRRQLLEEFANREGIEVVTSRKALPHGYKSRFDGYASDRLREMIGVQPRKVAFPEWLQRQPTAFQDDYLGVTRARLFRDGGLTLKRFVDRAGREIPLRDLARTEAAAFRAAGLDPARFLARAA